MERRRSSRHSNNDNHGQSNSASGASGSHHSTSGSSHQLSNGSGSDGAEDGEASSSFSKHGNGGDNSSSDSADAASAALTQRRAHVGDRVATRRSGQHLAHVKGSSTLVPTREGSPPENDSASGDSNNGSNDATQSNGGTGSAASNEQKRAGSGGSGGGGSGSNSMRTPRATRRRMSRRLYLASLSRAPSLRRRPFPLLRSTRSAWSNRASSASFRPQGLRASRRPRRRAYSSIYRLTYSRCSTAYHPRIRVCLLRRRARHCSPHRASMPTAVRKVMEATASFRASYPSPARASSSFSRVLSSAALSRSSVGRRRNKTALAAHQQGVLGGDGTAIPFQMPQAQHAMPRVAPIASATVARSEDDGFTGEPPAKRAAASTLDASGMVVDGAEEPAKGVTAPRHTRAEFG